VNAVVARILELHRNDLRGPEGVAGPVGPQGHCQRKNNYLPKRKFGI
jgi:hypothetical protein